MEKYISLAASVPDLDAKWSRQAESYKCILMSLTPAPTRDRDGTHTGPMPDRIEDRGLRIEDREDLKEGTESKPEPAVDIENFDIHELASIYPRQINTMAALAMLRDQILSRADFDKCKEAIEIYEKLCTQEKRKYKDFDSWVKADWRQWLNFKHKLKSKASSSPTTITPEIDRSQESLTLDQILAMKKSAGL